MHSKNLIPYPFRDTTKTVNGITFTDNGDGSITIKGTATADVAFSLCKIDFGDKPINAISVDSATNGIYTASKRLYYNQNHKGTTINILSGSTIDEIIYPQIELGKTATAYAQYHESYPLVVSRCGKNLFNQYAESKFIYPYRGIVVSDFCNNVNSAMYTLSVSLKQGATFQEGINFGLIRMNNSNGSSARWFQTKTDTNFRFTYTSMNSLDHIPDFYVALIGIYPSTEDNWNRIINNYNIQIECGKPPTDYEPYQECADYTPTANGTVEGVESLYPSTTLLTNDPYGKVYIDCDYYKDIDKTFNELTTSVALSGGE